MGALYLFEWLAIGFILIAAAIVVGFEGYLQSAGFVGICGVLWVGLTLRVHKNLLRIRI